MGVWEYGGMGVWGYGGCHFVERLSPASGEAGKLATNREYGPPKVVYRA